MPVKDIEFTSVDARKFTRRGERPQFARLEQNSTVSMILPLDDATADVEFRFTVSYGAVATIKIEGRMLFTGDARALVATWREKSQMPNEIASEIHSAILMASIPEAVLVARGMHLPPPIQLPQVKFENKPGGSARGVYEPEVA